MSAIQLTNVQKRFGDVTIIPGLDLTIEDGKFVVFVGPSGCGKSTLLRLIAGLEDVSGGKIEIDGQDVTNVSPARRGLAMVFQSYALYPHMSVRANIGFPLKMAGVSKADIARKVEAAAATLNLTDYLERRPRELSGGQRQRVAIGRAIVREPNGFLFDEPLSNLDAALRVNMRLELSELHQQLGTTMIYVTHDQVEAMTMADKIVVLNKGRVEQVGSPLELYRKPANLFVAGFIGSPAMNMVSGRLDPNDPTRFVTGDGTVLPVGRPPASAQGKDLVYGMRPEALTLSASGVPLQVVVIEPTGYESQVVAKLGQSEVSCVFRERVTVAPGETIHVAIDPNAIHLFDAKSGQRLVD